MSLWKIAWRSIEQRALASALTAFSMALGVALVVTVLVIHQVVDQSFRRGAQGYNLIVGAKGGRLELVLSTVYHLGRPIENIPYKYYLEFTEGRFRQSVDAAIPICMGDSYEGFPVIGTVPEMFTELQYQEGQKYEFASGGNFHPGSEYEAVAGWQAARKAGLAVGGTFRPAHGLIEKGAPAHTHRPFTIAGVLAPTGTPMDRALFVNMEGFFHLEGHLRPAAGAHPQEEPAEGEAHDHDVPISDDQKRITAILVSTKEDWLAAALAKQINEDSVAQAVMPAQEIAGLLDNIVGNIQLLLLLLAILVVVVAGIGILVSIYNSMNDRRHEIAVMRALGARRSTVMVVILLESVLLSLGGGLLGLLLGHGLIALLGPTIEGETGVIVGAWAFQWAELILIPGLIALAAIVGYLPAAVAYRTDVAKSLSG
jgi:putative ABC transport system permease protein